MGNSIGREIKPVNTMIIKDVCTTDNSRRLTLWRAVFSKYPRVIATFFIDLRFEGHLVDRQCYDTYENALITWYKTVSEASHAGYTFDR